MLIVTALFLFTPVPLCLSLSPFFFHSFYVSVSCICLSSCLVFSILFSPPPLVHPPRCVFSLSLYFFPVFLNFLFSPVFSLFLIHTVCVGVKRVGPFSALFCFIVVYSRNVRTALKMMLWADIYVSGYRLR